MNDLSFLLTSVQKEILQTLINLYQNSDSKSIKGESIAEVMNRNPGTIRNQMQSLRSLGLVKGVPGPRGGYKPTIEAYHTLNISFTDNSANVPIFKNEKKLEDASVAKIEFTSITHPGECEAAIKVLGNIKNLNIGDTVRVGPTPVNKSSEGMTWIISFFWISALSEAFLKTAFMKSPHLTSSTWSLEIQSNMLQISFHPNTLMELL